MEVIQRHLASVLAVAAILSFAAANWGPRNEPEITFYLLPTRAWEIIVGALAAFYMIRKKSTDGRYLWDELAAGAGLCLIVASVFLAGRSRHHVWQLLSSSAHAGNSIDYSFFLGKYRGGKNIGLSPGGKRWSDKLQRLPVASADVLPGPSLLEGPPWNRHLLCSVRFDVHSGLYYMAAD